MIAQNFANLLSVCDGLDAGLAQEFLDLYEDYVILKHAERTAGLVIFTDKSYILRCKAETHIGQIAKENDIPEPVIFARLMKAALPPDMKGVTLNDL